MRRVPALILLSTLTVITLSACGGEQPAPPNDLDPQAGAAAASAESPPPATDAGLQGTELRDAIQQPLDKARAAEAALQQDAANTAAQIEAAEREANGEAPADQ